MYDHLEVSEIFKEKNKAFYSIFDILKKKPQYRT